MLRIKSLNVFQMDMQICKGLVKVDNFGRMPLLAGNSF